MRHFFALTVPWMRHSFPLVFLVIGDVEYAILPLSDEPKFKKLLVGTANEVLVAGGRGCPIAQREWPALVGA